MTTPRAVIAAYFAVLFVLHQDFWWKADATLVLGVLPVSLAYHAVWTLFVAFGWWLVGRYCWPSYLDEADRATDTPPAPPAARPPR